MMNDHKAYRSGLFATFDSEVWSAATHVMSWSNLGRAVEEAWGPGPHEAFGSWRDLQFKANSVRADALLAVAYAILGARKAIAFMDPQLPTAARPVALPTLNLAHVSDVFRLEDWLVVTEAVSIMTGSSNSITLSALAR